MSDQIILKSVGSYLDTSGHVGPLNASGYPDLYGDEVDLGDLSQEWIDSLNAEDRGAVNSVLEDHRLPPLRGSGPSHVSDVMGEVMDRIRSTYGDRADPLM